MAVPREKAHRSFIGASRCFARLMPVRDALATRADCRYNVPILLFSGVGVSTHTFVLGKLKSSPLKRLQRSRHPQLGSAAFYGRRVTITFADIAGGFRFQLFLFFFVLLDCNPYSWNGYT